MYTKADQPYNNKRDKEQFLLVITFLIILTTKTFWQELKIMISLPSLTELPNFSMEKTINLVISIGILYLIYYMTLKNGTRYKFYLLRLTWSTSCRVNIYGFRQNDIAYTVTNYLKNNRKTKLEIIYELHASGGKIVIGLIRERRFFPVSYNSLKLQLRSLLHTQKMVIADRERLQIPQTKYKEREIRFNTHSPNLQALFELMEDRQMKGVMTRITTQYHGDISYMADKEGTQQKYNLFESSFIIGIDGASDRSFDEILRIMQTSSSDINYVSRWRRRREALNRKQLSNFLSLPVFDKFKVSSIAVNSNPGTRKEYDGIIGDIIKNGNPVADFGICASDFSEGGLITGAIGQGKTTLRLHIMDILLQEDVRIIDFDLKGDSSAEATFANQTEVLIPGINFQFNPFRKPKFIALQDYSSKISSILIESLVGESELSPAQEVILQDAILLTVDTNGNGNDFLYNIILMALKSQQVLDNYQLNSAFSLVSKFQWMKGTLGRVFSTDDTSGTRLLKSEKSLVFDLSELKKTNTIGELRILINIILNYVVQFHTEEKSKEKKNKLNTAVFLDEAQVLLPRHSSSKLSVIEEIVTTMRYRGIAVIAIGVSPTLISPVMIDTGFITQYRSDSLRLAGILGLQQHQERDIHTLQPYEAIIKTKNLQHQAVHVRIKNYEGKKVNTSTNPLSDLSGNLYSSQSNFDFDVKTIRKLQLLVHFPNLYSIQRGLFYRIEQCIQPIINTYHQELATIANKTSNEDFATILGCIILSLFDCEDLMNYPSIISEVSLFLLLHKRNQNIDNIHTLKTRIENLKEYFQDTEYLLQRGNRMNFDLNKLLILAKFANKAEVRSIKITTDETTDYCITTKSEIKQLKHLNIFSIDMKHLGENVEYIITGHIGRSIIQYHVPGKKLRQLMSNYDSTNDKIHQMLADFEL